MNEAVATAMALMSATTRENIANAMTMAFNSPEPPITAEDVTDVLALLRSPDAIDWFDLMMMSMRSGKEDLLQRPKYRQVYKTYIDGTQAVLEHPPLPPVPDNPRLGGLQRALQHAHVDKVLGEDQAEKVMRRLRSAKLDAVLEQHQAKVMEAARKVGIPEKPGDVEAGKAKAADQLKTVLTRQAVKSAVANGVWTNAALTGLCDFHQLVQDGDFTKYMVKVGISGAHGGMVGGLSTWIKHPVFGNNAVVGLLVGSAFGTVSLASTGDWARFGKNLGVNIASTGAARVGGQVCAFAAGFVSFGPLGIGIMTLAGSLAGAKYGRQWATKLPHLGGMTDCEVETMYKSIKEQLSAAGMAPDPKLSKAEVVAKVMESGSAGQRMPFIVEMTESHKADVLKLKDELAMLWAKSPTDFDEYLRILEATAG